jgi:hypothetical protein
MEPARLIAYPCGESNLNLKGSRHMKTGLLTFEAFFSVEDRARAKALKTTILLVAAAMMFSAAIWLNVWLAAH